MILLKGQILCIDFYIVQEFNYAQAFYVQGQLNISPRTSAVPNIILPKPMVIKRNIPIRNIAPKIVQIIGKFNKNIYKVNV